MFHCWCMNSKMVLKIKICIWQLSCTNFDLNKQTFSTGLYYEFHNIITFHAWKSWVRTICCSIQSLKYTDNKFSYLFNSQLCKYRYILNYKYHVKYLFAIVTFLLISNFKSHLSFWKEQILTSSRGYYYFEI